MKRDGVNALAALVALEERMPANELERLITFRTDRRGRKGRANTWEVMSSVLLHPLFECGTLGEHFSDIHGDELAESSLSERRQNIPWQLFREVMEWLLKPLAEEKRHPKSFYKGYRLIGLDGTGFSLRNSRSILRQCEKTVTHRLKAAFAKTTVSVLVELGTHNPVGAEIARQQESEWNLSCKVLKQLPKKSLLFGDRLYGAQRFVRELFPHCKRTSSTFLLRVRKQVKSKIVRRLRDGSNIVLITVRTPGGHHIEWSREVREIRVSIQRKGQRAFILRLWTNFLDEKRYPAQELAELYAKRWEHELYYRELKHVLHNGNLLNSQTVETSCQELAALLLATSVIAESRLELAEEIGQSEVTLVGFKRALFHTQFIFLFKMADENILTSKQRKLIAENIRKRLAPDKIPKKRTRSCPRAVRQQRKRWPRLTKNQNNYAEWNLKII